jgi:hypothetical protein
MSPGDGEFADLRLAAKAADRQKAAREQWPAFEARLRDLGYGSKAIARAFSSLSGRGSVAEALQVLEHTNRSSRAVALSFEVKEPSGNYSTGKGLAITSVERDGHEIRVSYDFDMTPPLGLGAVFDTDGPRGEAKDDLGNVYRQLGSHFGLAADDASVVADERACGGFALPLPDLAATELRIRITWNTTLASIWEAPAGETVVSLRN